MVRPRPSWNCFADVVGTISASEDVVPLPVADVGRLAVVAADSQGCLLAAFGRAHEVGWQVGEALPRALTQLQAMPEVASVQALYRGFVFAPVTPYSPHILIGHAVGDLGAEQAASAFRSLFEKIPAGLLHLQPEGRLLAASEVAQWIFGEACPVGAPCQQVLEVVHPQDHRRVLRAAEHAMREGHATTEFRFAAPGAPEQGRRGCTLLLRHAATLDALVFDVTDHPDFAQRLALHEAPYADEADYLAEGAVGLVHLDASGLVTYENPTFRKLLRRHPGSPSTWVGRSVYELDDLHRDVRHRIERLLLRGEVFRTDATLSTHDEAALPQVLMLHGSPMRALSGHVTGAVLMVQEALPALEASDQHVPERFMQMLVHLLSHEMRTPLGAVNGFSELLLHELEELPSEALAHLPSEIAEFATTIRDESQRLLVLVNDLFDLSTLETGTLQVGRTPFAVHEVVLQATRKASTPLRRKGLDLHLDLARGPLVVLGDERRTEQIVGNLLSNAIKFTQRGRVTVRTALRRSDDESEVQITIEDTGVGMTEAFKQRLFEPFSQEDRPLERAVGGSGLGLALVDRLTRQMGGRVEVESEKGCGSAFHVFLPAAGAP